MSAKEAAQNAQLDPSQYTEAVAQEICKRLLEGESLRGIYSNDHTSSMSTASRWLSENEKFQQQYTSILKH